MKPNQFSISIWLWIRLILELRRRGYKQRESGAFLLSKHNSRRITEFICYDDLDPTALDSGIIIFHGAGFVPLWEYCRINQMKVAGDIHTHSDNWTGQSEADRTHPMVGQVGHMALIAPYYAQKNLTSLAGVSIYEYRGNHEWSKPSEKLKLTFFTCPS